MNFQEAFKSVQSVNKSLSFHQNMASTLFDVWFSFPEHRAKVEKSVLAHIRVEKNLVDRPFTDAFQGVIS